MSTRRTWTMACVMPIAVTLAACGDDPTDSPSDASTRVDSAVQTDASTVDGATAPADAGSTAEPRENDHADGEQFGGADNCVVDLAEDVWYRPEPLSRLIAQQGSLYFTHRLDTEDGVEFQLGRLEPPYEYPAGVGTGNDVVTAFARRREVLRPRVT